MKKENIITEISSRTGIREEQIDRVLKEFIGLMKESEDNQHITNVPGIGTVKLNLEESPGKYETSSSRHHIIKGIHSKRNSKEILQEFMKISGLSNKILAEKIFEISRKTLLSYRDTEKDLPVRMKEQILKLEILYKKGIELFQNTGNFNTWLMSESYGLGSSRPVDLLNSITGSDLVFEELVRIEFGATA